MFVFSLSVIELAQRFGVCRSPEALLEEYQDYSASDFFQDWWAEVTHGAKNGGSFSEMKGPSISN